MAKRSRRRKSAARRKSRRRHAGAVALSSNPPRRTRKRGRRAGARRNPARRGRARARRNPPGLFGGLMEAATDGAAITGGVVVQNNAVRYIPDILPATMAQAPLLNGLLKDVALIVAGSYGAHKVLGRDAARMFVGGQTFAAIARVLRATAVPVLSTSLGEYDPIRLSGVGTYVRGLPSPAPVPANRRIAAPAPGNVARLNGVGVYVDGMSSAPGMF